MAVQHLIVRSIKQLLYTNAPLTAALAGDVHYGRVNTNIPRPFGSLKVTEKGREYNSGGGSLVDYEVTLKIYGNQKVSDVGELLQDFAALMNRTRRLPAIPYELAEVVAIIPTGGPIEEDDDTERGKDCLIGQASWLITLNESEKVLA